MPVDYRAMIPSLSFRNQAFINGKYVASASGKTFDCTSPIDGRVLTKVAACDGEDVNRAVAAASPIPRSAAAAPIPASNRAPASDSVRPVRFVL